MIEEHRERGWDVAWRSDTTPWDAGSYQPALKERPPKSRDYNEVCKPLGYRANIHVRFEVADFFALTGVKFDLVYDYTFFVAIPPARRGYWGRQMAEIVKSGGILITLIFPIDDDAQTGPPYYVRPQHYNEVLGEGWEALLDKEPEHTLESHKGRGRIVVRRRL
ncbi:S-adenosyl-L-methionine-dependent methyltransferase [Dichomitus squalens LYAD-421 SS1]|uniref:S-adenosyl-L-methionine-dependent methyltransferase n=2 Tax=Dichomitus squalens TaxID=114155 RepID=A0A4Q9M6F6_9APHY|nr:S-adenosyl-L-methionine-dependent methyltransferase [Dichomitus squalens LYAD-421 SS1]EJF61498.1 S-adenosyl-L-methionine-dependent methyltransferase [Dichomitus squalens LYAD-421 SS1]TBU21402.1 S-adenosyl-L-methionine-dependent methyltransferase [Dichomitus squalens]